MAFTRQFRVTGNRIVVVGRTAAECQVEACIRLRHLVPACLRIPAAEPGSAPRFVPTAVLIQRVVHNLAEFRRESVRFALAPPAPPSVGSLRCRAVRARWRLTLNGAAAVLAWRYVAVLTYTAEGQRVRVRARSAPRVLACDAGPVPTLGRWEAEIDALCLGCAVVGAARDGGRPDRDA